MRLNKIIALIPFIASAILSVSCDSGETYAEKKEKEKTSIQAFLRDNDIIGPVTEITESQFEANGYKTDVTKNEFVKFEDDGIYMQIVEVGAGKKMAELAEESSDSIFRKNILCRFVEYNIQSGDTLNDNTFTSSDVDKMLVAYTKRNKSFTASFTSGVMTFIYQSSEVPKSWIKPLEYINLTRKAGEKAKVRIITPHSSGTTNASNLVYPTYYEISYQLGV